MIFIGKLRTPSAQPIAAREPSSSTPAHPVCVKPLGDSVTGRRMLTMVPAGDLCKNCRFTSRIGGSQPAIRMIESAERCRWSLRANAEAARHLAPFVEIRANFRIECLGRPADRLQTLSLQPSAGVRATQDLV